jgi:hypothetical protein
MAGVHLYRSIDEGFLLKIQGSCGPVGRDLRSAFSEFQVPAPQPEGDNPVPLAPVDILVFSGSPDHRDTIRAQDPSLGFADRLEAAACSGMNAGLTAFGVRPIGILQHYEPVGDSVFSCLNHPARWLQCPAGRRPTTSNTAGCTLSAAKEQRREAEWARVYP